MKKTYSLFFITFCLFCNVSYANSPSYFFGVETSYTLTNPTLKRVGSGFIDGIQDKEFDKEFYPGFYAGAILSQHHRVKLGYMDKDIWGASVARYYTSYDYIYNFSDKLNLIAGFMIGYDDFETSSEYSDLVTGLQIGAEYKFNDFSVELGYQASENDGDSEGYTVFNPDFSGDGVYSASGTDYFEDDNMLFLRLNYYFGTES